MSKLSIMKEFLDFLIKSKRWWLIPIAVFLMLLGALIVFTQSSSIAPFVYTLF